MKNRLDRTVLPLYTALCENKDVRGTISSTCNVPGSTFSIFPEQALNNLCDVVRLEVPPLSNLAANDNRILSISSAVNKISDLFQAPPNVDTAQEFIILTNCAEAIYDGVQKARSKDVLYSSEAPNQVGLYYLMRHVSVEMPFGWWYKCLVLQSRTMFNSFKELGQKSIQCKEWTTSSIPESDLQSTDYTTDTVTKLLRIDGGVTSKAILDNIQQLLDNVYSAVSNYINGGYTPSIGSEDSTNPFSHPGVSANYNQASFFVDCFFDLRLMILTIFCAPSCRCATPRLPTFRNRK